MTQNNITGNFLHSELSDLWILLMHTTYAISRQRELELNSFGVTIEQHALLHVLTLKDGENISEIAAVRLRQHHSIFTLVNRMEKQGLVKKMKFPRSKEYRIFITDKGREIYGKTTIDSLKEAFSVLTADDQQKLSQYLKLLLMRTLSRQGFDYKLPFLL